MRKVRFSERTTPERKYAAGWVQAPDVGGSWYVVRVWDGKLVRGPFETEDTAWVHARIHEALATPVYRRTYAHA